MSVSGFEGRLPTGWLGEMSTGGEERGSDSIVESNPAEELVRRGVRSLKTSSSTWKDRPRGCLQSNLEAMSIAFRLLRDCIASY